MAAVPPKSPGSREKREDLLHRHIARGICVHHIILSLAFFLLLALGIYFIVSEDQALERTAISSYQQTELEIVRDAARSTREYVYVQTVTLNRTDIGNIEQEVFRKIIDPIRLLKSGDAWIYAPDHVVYDKSTDFPDQYRNKSMAQIFELQKGSGASHYEEMTAGVMNAREGTGYYIWLPEKGPEIAAWTPVTVGNYTWTIGLSTPLPEILDATGATMDAQYSTYIILIGIIIALILYLAWLHADISRWRSDEILRESEERYAAIVDNTPGPVLILRSGEIRFINQAGIAASGYTREELVGRDIMDFLPDSSKSISREATNIRAGTREVSEYEVEFRRKDGRILRLIVRAIEIMYQGEEVTLAILVDITERKRTGEALMMANKKLSLLSGVTRHDINNQLVALSGYIELSGQDLGDQARTAEYIRKEGEIVRTITTLIAFTKDYENMGLQAPAWQNVSSLVARAASQLPVRNIRIDGGNPMLEIFADPLLGRVFYNLIDNALRYGGDSMTTIRVSCSKEPDGLLLIVQDDGTGIRAEDKARLFTRGFGRNTGLGLFLSREILAITGIVITETGSFGRGARFEIRVPEGAFRFAENGASGSS